MHLGWQPQNTVNQSVTVNGQMIQSIKLLQFSSEELTAFVGEQCERNPLIEMPATQNARVKQLDTPSPRTGTSRSPGGTAQNKFSDHREIEHWIATKVSLQDHLHRQVGSKLAAPRDRAIATEIIESLDEDGYLRRALHAIADALGVAEAAVESVLSEIQRMDPPGVGARTLAECLRLQLQETPDLTGPMKLLLENLPLLGKHEYRQLAQICGSTVEGVLAMATRIKALDPRPGLQFDNSPQLPAIPDVTITLGADGTIRTELNSETLPRVLVNREYYSEVKGRCRNAEDVKFVVDCMSEAKWLVRNIDLRAQTILKVATAIATRQREFLAHGIDHLKPLNLKQVADAVGVHQSTVCRAISNKYAMTPRGLFELRFFFAGSLSASDGGEGVAADKVRHRIRQLINDETSDAVLSDDAIVNVLHAEGVEMARRTVAKYREAMRIPSSQQRRRQKQAQQIQTAARSEQSEPIVVPYLPYPISSSAIPETTYG